MKKLFLVFLLAGLWSCSGITEEKSLFVYNWSYYIPDSVLEDFKKETGIKLVYDVYSSNEEMFTKLQAGAKGYDIVFPTNDYVSVMRKAGMLEELDKSQLGNLTYLDQAILDKISYDKGLKYSIPYVLGATGIAVNKKFVKDYPRDFSIFEKSELKGKMTLLDDMREVLGSALIMLGYSPDSVKDSELAQAKELALKWKKNIVKFDAESFGKGFAQGEYWVVQGYAENVFQELDEKMKKDVDFFLPQKGCQMYIDSIVLLKDAKHKKAAYQFMNYVHRPEVYAKIMDFVKSPSVNVEARKFIKEKTHYSIEDMDVCRFKDDLGNDIEKQNKIWEELVVE